LVVVALAILIAYSGDGRPGAIRLAYQNRIGSAIVIVAVEEGFFADEGLSIETYRFNSGPACSEALFSGSADIGTMGDATAVIAASRGSPLTIIASHGRGEHRHRIVVGPDSTIRTPADLVGKRVAVKKGTSTYGGFLAYLDSHGLNPASLHIIDVPPADMPDALLAGSVDALVASEPTPSLAEARGARQLATLGRLGNSYPILILAKNDLLTHHPQNVHGFIRALHRAEAFVRDQPDQTAAILARVTGLSPEVANQAMRRHTYELTLDAAIIASLGQTAEFLTSQGIIDRPPDFNLAAADQYLTATSAPPQADPEP
jgi:aliphatic sulfonates family ABC transporter substrate-binding protein